MKERTEDEGNKIESKIAMSTGYCVDIPGLLVDTQNQDICLSQLLGFTKKEQTTT